MKTHLSTGSKIPECGFKNVHGTTPTTTDPAKVTCAKCKATTAFKGAWVNSK